MKTAFVKFLKNLIIYSLALGVIATLVIYFAPAIIVTPTLPYLIIFFFASTILVHYILLKSLERKFARFTNVYMLITTIKLLFFLGIIAIYAFSNRDDAIRFSITFVILYLFYAFFEVIEIIKISRSNKANPLGDKESVNN
jgi:hypothetical protein